MLVFHEPGCVCNVNILTNDSFLLRQTGTWLWSPLAMKDQA